MRCVASSVRLSLSASVSVRLSVLPFFSPVLCLDAMLVRQGGEVTGQVCAVRCVHKLTMRVVICRPRGQTRGTCPTAVMSRPLSRM